MHSSPPIDLLLGNNTGSIPIDLVVMFVDMDCYAILVIKLSYCLLVFYYSSLHSLTCFPDIDQITVSAGDVVNYTFLLLIRYPILQSHKCLLDDTDRVEDSFNLTLTGTDGVTQPVNPFRIPLT